MAALRHLLDQLRYHWRLHNVARLRFGARGDGVVLHNGSIFSPPEGIRFGSHIYVGPEARFYADGGIRIGDNVSFSPRVTIYSSNHLVAGAGWLPYGPVSEKGEVRVGANVWIGAQAILLPGVRIGEGAVVAAGSVVARDVPPLAMAAGNPAVVRRYRDPREYRRLVAEGKLFLKAEAEGAAPATVFQERPRTQGPIEQTPRALEERRAFGLDSEDFQD
jgi:maltose O-acetyltransferase